MKEYIKILEKVANTSDEKFDVTDLQRIDKAKQLFTNKLNAIIAFKKANQPFHNNPQYVEMLEDLIGIPKRIPSETEERYKVDKTFTSFGELAKQLQITTQALIQYCLKQEIIWVNSRTEKEVEYGLPSHRWHAKDPKYLIKYVEGKSKNGHMGKMATISPALANYIIISYTTKYHNPLTDAVRKRALIEEDLL